MMTWPGSAYFSAMIVWQMPSAPGSFGSCPVGADGVLSGEAAVSVVQLPDGRNSTLRDMRKLSLAKIR